MHAERETVLAALLAISLISSPPSLVRDSRHPQRAHAALLSEKQTPAGVTLAWGEHPPVLPAGTCAVKARPAGEAQPLLLGIPVQTQPPFPRRRVDPERLARTTGELEGLLKTAQPEIMEASKGRLPKDLIPDLKRIEKLSEQLRRELSP